MWSPSSDGKRANNLQDLICKAAVIHGVPSKVSSATSVSPSSPAASENKTMEDIWEGTAALPEALESAITTAAPSIQSLILQEFLQSRSPNKDRPVSAITPADRENRYHEIQSSFSAAAPGRRVSYSPTGASTPSGEAAYSFPPDVNRSLLEGANSVIISHNASQLQLRLSPPFASRVDRLPSPGTCFFSAMSNKRGPAEVLDESGNDLRRKRLIKNRESADRSRARKQAYTNELENDVARLKKENASLKSQIEKLRLAASAKLPKKALSF